MAGCARDNRHWSTERRCALGRAKLYDDLYSNCAIIMMRMMLAAIAVCIISAMTMCVACIALTLSEHLSYMQCVVCVLKDVKYTALLGVLLITDML